MLEGFNSLLEGEGLHGILDALVSSSGHPALRNACIIVMCGVACLPQAHDIITKRKDVQKALFGALADPRPQRINPGDEQEELYVSPAVGAAICPTGECYYRSLRLLRIHPCTRIQAR